MPIDQVVELVNACDESVIQLRQAVEIEKIANPDLDQDMKLLFEMEHELTIPRIVRWIRRKITSVKK